MPTCQCWLRPLLLYYVNANQDDCANMLMQFAADNSHTFEAGLGRLLLLLIRSCNIEKVRIYHKLVSFGNASRHEQI